MHISIYGTTLKHISNYIIQHNTLHDVIEDVIQTLNSNVVEMHMYAFKWYYTRQHFAQCYPKIEHQCSGDAHVCIFFPTACVSNQYMHDLWKHRQCFRPFRPIN